MFLYNIIYYFVQRDLKKNGIMCMSDDSIVKNILL